MCTCLALRKKPLVIWLLMILAGEGQSCGRSITFSDEQSEAKVKQVTKLRDGVRESVIVYDSIGNKQSETIFDSNGKVRSRKQWLYKQDVLLEYVEVDTIVSGHMDYSRTVYLRDSDHNTIEKKYYLHRLSVLDSVITIKYKEERIIESFSYSDNRVNSGSYRKKYHEKGWLMVHLDTSFNGSTLSLYGPDGRLEQIVDRYGKDKVRRKQLLYNEDGKIKELIATDNSILVSRETFSYTDNGQLLTRKIKNRGSAEKILESYKYDSKGLLIQKIVNESNVLEGFPSSPDKYYYQYDSLSRLVSIIEDRGIDIKKKNWKYNGSDVTETDFIKRPGVSSDREKEDALFTPVQLTITDTIRKRKKYFALFKDGIKYNAVLYNYNDSGALVEESYFGVDSVFNGRKTYFFDKSGREIGFVNIDKNGNPVNKRTKHYDARGNLTLEEFCGYHPRKCAKTEISYDDQGREIEMRFYSNDSAYQTKRKRYSEKRLVEITEELIDGSRSLRTSKITFKYDEFDNLIEEQHISGESEVVLTFTWEYLYYN
jgi:hypothetical protein